MSATTMNKLTRDSLMSLETYAKARPAYRRVAMAHKKLRTVHIGDHVTLLFEDDMTIRYQLQEVLRIEKAFEESAIMDELDAYNPLIPNGRDFRATMLIEYTDEAERRIALTKIKGIENKTWVQVEGAKKVYAIADEDLERDDGHKTSAVHFLRFPLTDDMISALKYGVTMQMGCDHAAYQMSVEVNTETRNALVMDLK
jgi:hypothetical protein